MTTDTATAIGILISAATGAVVSIYNAIVGKKRSHAISAKVTEVSDKSDAVDSKLDDIHAKNAEIAVNTNGNLSRLRDELVKQANHNNELQKTINTLTAILAGQKVVAPREVRAEDLKPIKVEVVNAQVPPQEPKESQPKEPPA